MLIVKVPGTSRAQSLLGLVSEIQDLGIRLLSDRLGLSLNLGLVVSGLFRVSVQRISLTFLGTNI